MPGGLANSLRLFERWGQRNRKVPWGLNFDSPPAQSRKGRLFWRISRYRRQISPVSEVLLQFTHGQITSFSQDFLVLRFQLFPKEFHGSGTCGVGTNSSPFAACPDAEFVSPMAGWPRTCKRAALCATHNLGSPPLRPRSGRPLRGFRRGNSGSRRFRARACREGTSVRCRRSSRDRQRLCTACIHRGR